MIEDGMDTPENGQPVEDAAAAGDDAQRTGRRQVLMLGAVAVGAAVSVRPALAQTAASVLNCQIPVPDGASAGQMIASDGSVVPAGTPGAFPGGRSFAGEEVRKALRGQTLPGTSYEESRAYMSYIRRLQYGRSGFTCYASLQMPR